MKHYFYCFLADYVVVFCGCPCDRETCECKNIFLLNYTAHFDTQPDIFFKIRTFEKTIDFFT